MATKDRSPAPRRALPADDSPEPEPDRLTFGQQEAAAERLPKVIGGA